jgi:adenine deaminase
MRLNEKGDRSRLMRAALQKEAVDLTITNVKFVNMFTGEIYGASVDVLDGTVVRVREEGEAGLPAREVYDGKGAYLIPGLIDVHMHVESTMLTPENMSRALVPWGITTVCTDPHEIANVMGVEGVRFMLENSQKSALRQYVLAPSCVPAVPGVESTGAEFGAAEVGRILDMEGVVGIAELMDFIGVYTDSPRMHSIIDEGIRRGMYLQAHGPELVGKELAAYILGGPEGDHESYRRNEVSEKLRNGLHINLRAGSFVNDLDELVQGFKHHGWYDFVSLCTDDMHASDILEKGGLNNVIRLAIKAGIPPLMAVKLATFNSAREYGFDDLGAIGPGRLADMQLVRELDGGRPEAVFIRGRLVAKNGEYLGGDSPEGQAAVCGFPNTVNIPQIKTADDFVLKAPKGSGGTVRVPILKQSDARSFLNDLVYEELPVVDGAVSIKGRSDLTFMTVVNRYGNGKTTIALTQGRCSPHDGEGAYGTTVSHDSHNLVILYRKPEDALLIARRIKELGGGICVAERGKITGELPLPIAGLMSDLPCEPLAALIAQTEAAVQKLFGADKSLLFAATQSLPCIPGWVVTDYGLVNGKTQEVLEWGGE